MGLQRAPRLSHANARAMILDLARHGVNSHNIPSTEPDEAIIAWFEENGEPFRALVEKVRNPYAPVPAVENLAGSDFTIATKNTGQTGITVRSSYTGISVPITGPGIFSMATYHSTFDAAVKSLNRAVDENSYQDLVQALVSGFSSLDAFIAERTAEWNRSNTTVQFVEPPFRRFDEKVTDWFPTLANGKTYDRGRADWSILKTLREIRNDCAAHPQQAVHAMDFVKMAQIMNYFSRGIAETLYHFHLFLDRRVPSSIIRARFAPKVFVH